jgi:hypothetical protein
MTALFSERAAGNVVEAAKDGEHPASPPAFWTRELILI